MNWTKNVPHRTGEMLGGTGPVVLGGSLVAAATCFVVLAVVAPSEGSILADPPRSLLAGLGLVALAAPLYLAARLVRTKAVCALRCERPIATTVLAVGLVCLVLGLFWIAHGAYPLFRLLSGN